MKPEEMLTREELEAEKLKINGMTQLDVCRLHRFALCGHPSFITGTELHKHFKKRFTELGGFTPEISKQLGW